MTADIPNRTCDVEGCHDPAVARLFGRDNTSEGLRCHDCLRSDLGATDTR